MEKSKEFLEQERRYNEIQHMEHEIELLQHSIQVVGYRKQYFSVFQLDKDDLEALIEVRKLKINGLKEDNNKEFKEERL